MQAIISSIIKELQLCDDDITNIYNYGSWVYGTNHEKSDRDFLIVMRCKSGQRAKPLRFRRDFDYFHSFELCRLSRYDVTIHSCVNFEKLLEKNYMLAVECVFYPDEFILRNRIDYKTIYLSKYYNPLRLKQVAFYENKHGLEIFLSSITKFPSDQQSIKDKPTLEQFLCDAVQITSRGDDRLLKYLFHGIRYLDTSAQLIQTRSIEDFKRVSYVLREIKDIYLKQNKDAHGVLDYFEQKSSAHKEMLNALLPTTNIQGTFKIFVTIDKYDQEQFHQFCQLHDWKPVSIENHNQPNSKHHAVSFDHVGRYPDIVQEVQTMIDDKLQKDHVRGMKILCSADLPGVPLTDIDKELFWDKHSSYFEFSHKVELSSKGDFKYFRNSLSFNHWSVMYDTCLETSASSAYCYVNVGVIHRGKESAFIQHRRIMNYLATNKALSLEVKQWFVVSDSNPNQCRESTSDAFFLPRDVPRSIYIPAKYRTGHKNRKFFPRSN